MRSPLRSLSSSMRPRPRHLVVQSYISKDSSSCWPGSGDHHDRWRRRQHHHVWCREDAPTTSSSSSSRSALFRRPFTTIGSLATNDGMQQQRQRRRRPSYHFSTTKEEVGELVSIHDHLDELHNIPLEDVRNFCIIAHVVSYGWYMLPFSPSCAQRCIFP